MNFPTPVKAIQDALESRDYDTAIRLSERLIEERPEELNTYCYLGLSYLLAGQEVKMQELLLSLALMETVELVENWIQELFQFLEVHIERYLEQRRLAEAKVIYKTLLELEPSYNNVSLLERLIVALSELGAELASREKYEAAIDVYLEILNLAEEHNLTWHSLGLCRYHLKQWLEAEVAIKHAIELDPSFIANYQLLGQILEEQNKMEEAISIYLSAIQLDCKNVDIYRKISSLYNLKKYHNQAQKILSDALEKIPNQVDLLYDLGLTYRLLNDRAKSSFYLGYSAFFKAEYYVALTELEIFHSLSLADEKNKNIGFYYSLAYSYMVCDQSEQAIKILQEGIERFPKSLVLKRINQVILPIIYNDIKDMDFYRNRFCKLLDDWIQDVLSGLTKNSSDVMTSLGLVTNFYLSYQGFNDLEIQKKYSHCINEVLKKQYSKFCQKSKITEILSDRKIKIGFISCHVSVEKLGLLYLNWLKFINKNKFEIYIYDVIYSDQDKLHEAKNLFQDNSDSYQSILYNTDLETICTTIMNKSLDILIFPELGLDAIFNLLSCLRFAPIQCTTWGHPITSGSPTIDYFLSSELMEPVNADGHYSETLIRLPNLGFSLPPVELPKLSKTRSDFNIQEDKIVYFCSQSLFKYLPQHDYIFPAIAQHSNTFHFAFIEAPAKNGPTSTENFRERLRKAFEAFGLNYHDYCTIMPRLKGTDFLVFNQLADIFLDGLSWSGGLTTRDALSCGLPVVTYPGELMRSRHSYAMLKMIGVTETIAGTEEEYIEIAICLGLDSDWRQTIQEKILTNLNRLFDDQECIQSLEDFLEQAVQDLVLTT